MLAYANFLAFFCTKSSEIRFEVQISDHLFKGFDLIGHNDMKYAKSNFLKFSDIKKLQMLERRQFF